MQVGKIAIERLQIAALYIHLASATKDYGAEAVPLGLEQEGAIRRQTLGELGQHGFNRRFDRKRHRRCFRLVSETHSAGSAASPTSGADVRAIFITIARNV